MFSQLSTKTAWKLLPTSGLAVMLLGSLLASCGGGGGGGGTPTLPAPQRIYLWVSVATSDGDFSVGDLSGVAAADAVCQREGDSDSSVLPHADSVGYTHQAVIADDAFTPDMIIKDDDTRKVYRPDDTTIIADSYQQFYEVNENPTVMHAVTDSASSQSYWTGLTREAVSFTCTNWSTTASIGAAGLSGSDDVNRIGGGSASSCNGMHSLLCISC